MGCIGIYINKNGQIKDNQAPLLLLNLIFSINIIAMTLRLIWVYTERPIIHYLSISEVHKIAYILVIITIIAISFTVFWILTERLISKIHKTSITDELTKLYTKMPNVLHTQMPFDDPFKTNFYVIRLDRAQLLN